MIGLLMLVAVVSNADIKAKARGCGVPPHALRIKSKPSGEKTLWLRPDTDAFSPHALNCFSDWTESVGLEAAIDFIPEMPPTSCEAEVGGVSRQP